VNRPFSKLSGRPWQVVGVSKSKQPPGTPSHTIDYWFGAEMKEAGDDDSDLCFQRPSILVTCIFEASSPERDDDSEWHQERDCPLDLHLVAGDTTVVRVVQRKSGSKAHQWEIYRVLIPSKP
jgi:hypothetical protein